MTAPIDREAVAADREQVADQFRAVAHLAQAIATVHSQIEPSIRAGVADDLLGLRGPWSGSRLEVLADILNNMDAVDPEDEWIDPIIERARERGWMGGRS